MATAQNKKLATAVSAEIAGPILSLTFANGERLTVDSLSLSPEIQHAAMMHGLKQKLIDAAAIARDPDTGRTATITDKYNAVLDVYNRITLPEGSTWNKARGNGEGGGNKGGLLLRAVMRLTSKSRADAMAWLEARSKDEVASLRKNPRIVEIIAQLQVETANTTGVDSDALLDTLMVGGGMDVEADDGSEEQPEEEPEEELTPAPEAPIVPSFPAPKAKPRGKGKSNDSAKA